MYKCLLRSRLKIGTVSLLPHSWSKQTMRHEARGGFVDSFFFKEMELQSSVTKGENTGRRGKLANNLSGLPWSLVAINHFSFRGQIPSLPNGQSLAKASVFLYSFTKNPLAFFGIVWLAGYIYDYSHSLPDW